MAFTWNEILKLKEGDLLHIEARNPHNAALNQTAFATFHRVDADKGNVWLKDVMTKENNRRIIADHISVGMTANIHITYMSKKQAALYVNLRKAMKEILEA